MAQYNWEQLRQTGHRAAWDDRFYPLTFGGTVGKRLFSITCTTCQARLAVRSRTAIGTIVECLKCGSMVHVTPPAGWVPPAPEPTKTPKPAVEACAGLVSIGPPPVLVRAAASSAPPAPQGDSGELPVVGAAGLPPVSSGAATSLLMHKWVLLTAASLVGLTVVGGTFFFIRGRSRPEPSATAVADALAVALPADQTQVAAAPQKPSPHGIDRRWLPDQSALVLSVRPSQLAPPADSAGLAQPADSELWRQTFGAVLPTLGLSWEAIDRITWISTDAEAWRQRSVVVIELPQDQHTRALDRMGEPAGFALAGAECRRQPKAAWPHPWAVVDPHTIVSGEEALLRELAGRNEIHLQSAPLDRLLKAITPDADVTLLVDLLAARKARGQVPAALLDVWPAGKQSWHVLCEMPDALGCTVQSSDRLRVEVAMACEGDTAADKAHAALNELLAAAKQAVAAQGESLDGKLQAGDLTVAVAEQYQSLLKEAQTALQAAHSEVSAGILWVRLDASQPAASLAAAAIGSRQAIRADWLSAALAADEANHHRLLNGLGGYRKAEGQWPAGAAGGSLLPPETRLSWIAALLPYYNHADWHRRLEFGYPWNGPQNSPVTRRPLPEVVNPALGDDLSDAGFPVTHYVGVAGVGADAGQLPADDPRAGVFGYGRSARPEQMPRGAANTIAILGVSDRVGPWAAGGDPTVRALTQQPYVNGPDGFGSGQPNGMLAGMADGSVRFVSKDVDPRVLEQLAAVHGSETVTASALAAKPAAVQVAARLPNPTPAQSGKSDKPVPAAAVKPEQPEAAPPSAPAAKAASPRADVEARLSDPIAAIELTDVPWTRALSVIAGMSTVPITLDTDALQDLDLTLSDPVTVRLARTTVGGFLTATVSARGLVSVVEDGQVVITSPADQRTALHARRYTVSDLTGDEPAATAELAALVQKLVVPDSWRANGGRGTITAQGGVLTVEQVETVHRRILAFCERLRTARGRPLRSRLDPDRFTLATRYDRAKPMLERHVTANFHEPAALAEIVAYLEETSQADILIDRLALNAAGLSGDTKTSLTVEKRKLAAVLTELLQPLGLAYRAVDGEVLQVTTRKALDARLELEFYSVAALLAKGTSGPALVEEIKGRLAGATWSDAGGPGVLYFDQPSGCLIVLQSQPVQVAIEQWLAEQAAGGTL